MLVIGKKHIRISILFFTGLICSVDVFAQSDQIAPSVNILQPFYPYSVEVGGGLIYPLGNKALESNFGGVYSVHQGC